MVVFYGFYVGNYTSSLDPMAVWPSKILGRFQLRDSFGSSHVWVHLHLAFFHSACLMLLESFDRLFDLLTSEKPGSFMADRQPKHPSPNDHVSPPEIWALLKDYSPEN